jgi:hypothetical protein
MMPPVLAGLEYVEDPTQFERSGRRRGQSNLVMVNLMDSL